MRPFLLLALLSLPAHAREGFVDAYLAGQRALWCGPGAAEAAARLESELLIADARELLAALDAVLPREALEEYARVRSVGRQFEKEEAAFEEIMKPVRAHFPAARGYFRLGSIQLFPRLSSELLVTEQTDDGFTASLSMVMPVSTDSRVGRSYGVFKTIVTRTEARVVVGAPAVVKGPEGQVIPSIAPVSVPLAGLAAERRALLCRP